MKITEAIQVCLSINDAETRPREMKGLLDALITYQLDQGLILTYEDEGEEIMIHDSKEYLIRIVPMVKWLLE